MEITSFGTLPDGREAHAYEGVVIVAHKVRFHLTGVSELRASGLSAARR